LEEKEEEEEETKERKGETVVVEQDFRGKFSSIADSQ